MEIKDIQPHITHFSEEIRMKANHMQEVKVAGTIKEIIPPMVGLMDDPLTTFYVIKIDDLVGVMYVYISQLVKEHYEDLIKEGNSVVFEGFAKVLSRTVHSTVKREVSIVAFDAKALPVEAAVV